MNRRYPRSHFTIPLNRKYQQSLSLTQIFINIELKNYDPIPMKDYVEFQLKKIIWGSSNFENLYSLPTLNRLVLYFSLVVFATCGNGLEISNVWSVDQTSHS